MKPKDLQMPEPVFKGLVPTLNRRGFMSPALDGFSAEFAQTAAGLEGWVLDMGCAYGIASRAALEKGARVLACDMDVRHVEILRSRMPMPLRHRLITAVGALPEMGFRANAFGAILCSRVVHFLRGQEVEAAVRGMFEWLTPGGRLFLTADSPYTGFWSRGAPAYEQKKKKGHPWPGFIEDISIYFPKASVPEGLLKFLNPMDPDILKRVCQAAGFSVEKACFAGRAGPDAQGREHAGVVAVKGQ